MKKLLLLAALLLVPTFAHAQTSLVYLGAGIYAGDPGAVGSGNSCPQLGSGGCSPNPHIQSHAINISFPSGAGTAVIPTGWLETYGGDADAGNVCNNPSTWTTHGFGTIAYNDGTIHYTGQVSFDMQWADTTTVPLPSGALCCWQSQTPANPYHQPIDCFVYKLNLRSCTNGHVATDRFFAVGCGGWVAATSAPCSDGFGTHWVNENWLYMTVSGF